MTTTALVPTAPDLQPAAVALGTLQASDARELVASATALAQPLADIIQRQSLYVTLRGRRHVRVEGWTTLAAMLGIVASEVEVTEANGVYTAIVELRRMSDGRSVTRASAECGRPDELDSHGNPMWSDRPAYARRSMALTRATGKACRLAFSWVMTLAGYDPTPAEEMDGLGRDRDEPPQHPTEAQAPQPPPQPKPQKPRPVPRPEPPPTESANGPTPLRAIATTVVLSVKPWQNQAGETVWFVEFADGTKASTMKQAVADEAMAFQRSKTPVVPALTPKTKGEGYFLNGFRK